MYPNELYHHGILGQKWGVRRFQNPDGSLTAEGRRRMGYQDRSKRNPPKATFLIKRQKKVPQTTENKSVTKSNAAAEPRKEFNKTADDIRAMSMDDLKAYKERLTIEESVYKLQNTLSTMQPKTFNGKRIEDLTADELRMMMSRLELEKNAHVKQSEVAAFHPKKESLKKKIAKTMVNDVLVPAAKNVGKDYVEKLLRDIIGLPVKNNNNNNQPKK